MRVPASRSTAVQLATHACRQAGRQAGKAKAPLGPTPTTAPPHLKAATSSMQSAISSPDSRTVAAVSGTSSRTVSSRLSRASALRRNAWAAAAGEGGAAAVGV